jgi:sporulation protein YlmC with PRC-barrel domain
MYRRLLTSAALPALLLASTLSVQAQETNPSSTPPAPPAAESTAPPNEPAAAPAEKMEAPAVPSPSASAESGASVNYATQQSTDQRRSSKIVGQAVYNAAGERIGDVNELILAADGKVESAVIGVGGFLGLGEKLVAVSFSELKIADDPNGSPRITLNSTKEALETAPDYKYAEDRRS